MSHLIIQGRRTISGTHRVSGNKNAALPMIAATLLTAEPVTLTNVPDISDVRVMLEAMKGFGTIVSAADLPRGTITLHTPKIKSTRIAPDLAAKLRTSFLFAGPLLARAGRASLPPPGGDQIGHRRLDTHFAGFKSLGAKAIAGKRALSFKGKLKGAKILLDEASVTATENILMASVLAEGTTEIYNAACEPHVADLANMLVGLGLATITGISTNRLTITPALKSYPACPQAGAPTPTFSPSHPLTFRVSADYIEAGSYLIAAAVTGGELTLENIDPGPFEILENVFARFGITWKIDEKAGALHYVPRKRLKMKYDLGDAIPSVADGPWPAFPSDLLSCLIVLASQTRGTCLFFEKMFESRLYFVDQLRQMGGKIVQCDPHRVVVTGPSTLYGAKLVSPDIRAGISLVIAALCAKGESVIHSAEIIDRGYVAIEKSLSSLGASIIRES